MEKLYDFLFHYNPYQKTWYAFKKEDSHAYFNGNRKIAIKNKEIDELIIDIMIKHRIRDAS